MLDLLSQATAPATQPSGWTPDAITAVVAGLIALVGAIAAAVVSVIVALRASTKAEAAHTVVEGVKERQDRQSERLDYALLHAKPPESSEAGGAGS